MFSQDFANAVPSSSSTLPLSDPVGPHCVSVSHSFPTDSRDHPPTHTKPTATPANFGRPRVRGLLKTARRSRQAPSSDHTDGSSPSTPPPIASEHTWDYINGFHNASNRKRPLGDESEERENVPWTSPDLLSETGYDSDSSAASASLSRHHTRRSHLNHHHHHRTHPGKRRREDFDDTFDDYVDPDYSPPTSTDSLDLDEEIIYWDYSRKCTPSTSDKKDSMWKTRSMLMNTSPIGGSGLVPMGISNAQALAAAQRLEESQKERKTTDLEDWDILKEMFANAAQSYESQPHSETIPLLRGIINECHRFMKLFHEPSIIYTPHPPSQQSPSSPGRKVHKDWVMSDNIHRLKTISASTSTAPRKSPPPPSSSEEGTSAKPAEKKCKCKDLPTAFYTVLGTTLFFFGNIIDTSPELCQPGEPSNPVVYWLATLDAFEIGENLPIRTNPRSFGHVDNVRASSDNGRTSPMMKTARPMSMGADYQSEHLYHTRGGSPSSTSLLSAPPEDWRMAVVWGRTLVSLAEELVRRQNESAKNPAFVAAQQASEANRQRDHERLVDALFTRSIVPQMPIAPAAPFAYGLPAYPFSVSEFFGGPRVHMNKVPDNNADTPPWPINSPLATLLSRRPPVPKRLSLDSGVTPHQLLILAQDQFSRGILHMPHPRHMPPTKDKRSVFSPAFLLTPDDAMSAGGNPTSGSHGHGHVHASNELPTFSRAKELYTIAYEVLLLSEKLEAAAEREQWARWANSVFSQMKMEADTDVAKWRGLITGARGRCFVVVGTALAEGVEDRLEAGDETEDEILNSEDAIDARDALNEAIGYLEKGRDEFEAKMALEAQGGVVVEKDGEEEEMDEDEEMVVVENIDEDEDEDLVGEATPKPGPSSAPMALKPADSPSKSTSNPMASMSLANASPSGNANTPEDEIEELRMLLAEVLVSLANLTADRGERENLYKRAQAEGGDKIVLDFDDEDERMDETEN